MIPLAYTPIGFGSFIAPPNTSEKDIKREIKRKKQLMILIIYGMFLVVVFLFHFSIGTKIQNLFTDLNVPAPAQLYYGPWIAYLATIIFGGISYQRITAKDEEYFSIKTNEGYLQITPKNDIKQMLLPIIGLIVIMGFLGNLYISPIYSLTSQYK